MVADDDRDDVEGDDEWDDVELDADTMRGLLDDLIAEITTNADPLDAWDGISQAVPLALALDDAATARRFLAHAATLHEDGFATLFTARLVQLEVLVGAATDDEALIEGALDRLAALDGFDETVSATWVVVARQLLHYDRPAEAVDTCWRAVTTAQQAADDRPVLAALTIGHAADAVEDAGDASSALVLTEVALDLLAAHRDRLDTEPIAHELEAPAEADGVRVHLLHQLGSIAYREDQFDLAGSAWADADALDRATADDPVLADSLLTDRARVAAIVGDGALAADLAEQAVAAAEARGRGADRARAQLVLADIRRNLGDLDAAERLATDTLEIGQTFGDLELVADAQALLMKVAMHRGDLRRAHEAAEQKLDLLRVGGDTGAYVETMRDAAQLRAFVGDVAGAHDGLREVLAIAHEQDWPAMVMELQHALASVLAIRCEWREAIDLLHQSRRIAEEFGNALGVANAWWHLGRVGVAAALPDAGDHLDRAETIIETLGIARYAMYLAQERARLTLGAGDTTAAAAHLDEARRLGHELDDPLGQADTAVLSARLDLTSGDPERARERLTAALLEHEAAPDAQMLVHDHLLLGRAAAALGDTTEAERRLDAALERARAMAMLDAEVEALVALAALRHDTDITEAARARWRDLGARRPDGAPTEPWQLRATVLDEPGVHILGGDR